MKMSSFWASCVIILSSCTPAPSSNTVDIMSRDQGSRSETSSSPTLTANGVPVPQLRRCYMEECSWSVEKGRTTVKENANGSLIRLSLLGGTSHHTRTADYPGRYTATEKIAWNRSGHEVYVFCSKRLPAVVMKTAGGWQADVLDFVNGPPGVLESSASLYVSVCHGANAHWSDSGFAKRYGYSSLTEAQQDVTVGKPEDIFDLASRTSPEISQANGSKKQCRKAGDFCLYDTGWQPTGSNSGLEQLSPSDGESGAGCTASDSSGHNIFTSSIGGPAVVKIGGKVISLQPASESERYWNESYSGEEGALGLQVGSEIAEIEEGHVYKANITFTPPNGKTIRAEARLSCGA